MQQVMLFENKEFGEIRTLMIDGQPYFIGKDVAAALGYERPAKAILDHVDNEDKDEIPIQDSIGRMQNTPIINESGFYSLVLSSKLETAKKFKRWVTSEVLPSIRQTGNYISGTSPYSIEDIVRETICQVVPIIIKELEGRTEREKQAEKEIEKLEIKVRRKIERLICAGNHSYSSIARILTMDGIEISPTTVCFYAESMGIAD